MAAFNASLLPLARTQLTTATVTAAAWSPFAFTGSKLGRTRVKIWNGTAWVTAPTS